MEATGYLPNKTGKTPSKEMGAAICALAPIIPLDWLETTAHVAVFERMYDRHGNGEGRGSYQVADAVADHTVYTQHGLPIANLEMYS
jgi:hypothetical protein